jgi:hypothetical protein
MAALYTRPEQSSDPVFHGELERLMLGYASPVGTG